MMKKIIIPSLLIVGVVCFVFGDYYEVTVSRVESNLYKDFNTGVYIKTRYCYEYVYYEDAVLKWEGRYGDNWLIFDNGEKCEVEKLLKD